MRPSEGDWKLKKPYQEEDVVWVGVFESLAGTWGLVVFLWLVHVSFNLDCEINWYKEGETLEMLD